MADDFNPRTLVPAELNDFVLYTLAQDKKIEPTDCITPQYPLFKALELNNNGAIERRAPGQGLQEYHATKNPEHFTYVSATQDYQDHDFVPEDTDTISKYDWIQVLTDLTIPKFTVDNCAGANALVDIVRQKKRSADRGLRNKLVDILWNGLTVGTNHLFGIKEFIPNAVIAGDGHVHTNPATGNIGHIDATTAFAQTFWYSWAMDRSATYVTFDAASGVITASMDIGSTGLGAIWIDVTSNDVGSQDEGRPDLMPCNEVFYHQYDDLVKRRIIYSDVSKKASDLGIPDAYYYKGASVFYDPNVGDTPTPGEGMVYLVNSNAFHFCYAEGLEEQWSEIKQAKTGYYWSRTTQIGLTIEDRRKFGVYFGTQG